MMHSENLASIKQNALEVLKEVAQDFVNIKRFPEVEFNKVVLFDGNPDANIIVIARDLGKKEVEDEKPLVGQAGSLFREVSESVGFIPTRDFFMCNTVPMKPIGNKAFSSEVRREMSWVLRELISIVRPTYYLTLGKEATEWTGYKVERMRDMNGQEFNIRYVRPYERNVWIYPAFHPSYISRLKRQGLNAEDELRKPLLLMKRRWENGK